MSTQIARAVSRVCAVLLVWAGIGHSNLTRMMSESSAFEPIFTYLHWTNDLEKSPTILCLALIAAGVVIFVHRSFGYYVVYFAALVSLITVYQPIAYVPWSSLAATALGIEGRSVRSFLIWTNLFMVGMLAWTHYELFRAKALNRPLIISWSTVRGLLITGVAVSAVVTVLPIMGFVFALFIDPPGPAAPGGPSGGMIPFYVLMGYGRYSLLGAVALYLSLKGLRKISADHGA